MPLIVIKLLHEAKALGNSPPIKIDFDSLEPMETLVETGIGTHVAWQFI